MKRPATVAYDCDREKPSNPLSLSKFWYKKDPSKI
ncbi:hypothetical protein [Salmonella phage SD-1_S14]|nr:hypothetical protein [Salmonella phage SD-2_S15]WPK18890.1 hypothetical protein [Salmonella phage SD-6_S16]WPK19557.1 hypothetical protein [Salmonella phage SD-1_S14]WPK20585.1 hypothetical protein [Salmonella phage SD-15_S21]